MIYNFSPKEKNCVKRVDFKCDFCYIISRIGCGAYGKNPQDVRQAMKSVCKFISQKNTNPSIEAMRFVYETEARHLPILHSSPIYTLNAVMSGRAVMKCTAGELLLERGCLFVGYPCRDYSFLTADELVVTYVSFHGSGIEEALSDIGISETRPMADGLTEVCSFFDDAVRRTNQLNARHITLAAIHFALAAIADRLGVPEPIKNNENLFGAVKNYVDGNFNDPKLSLSLLSERYCYSGKYISALIKNNLGTGFSEYLTEKRISFAKSIMNTGLRSVGEVAFASGFSDPLYFSKVFKRKTGMTPTEYMLTHKDRAAALVEKLIK